MLLSSFDLLNENKLIMYFKFENPRILSSHSSTEIPSGSAHITFNQKYTYVYEDNWIIE